MMRSIMRSPFWCLCALVAWHTLAFDASDTPTRKMYETAVGGSAHVTLNNGSTVQLNTSTKLQTVVSATAHVAVVERGEAFFSVGSSPLQVASHGVSVSGTETSFSVRDNSDDSVDILVLSGFVHIDRVRNKGDSTMSSTYPIDQVASAGQLAAVHAGRITVHDLGSSGVQRKLMWRLGVLEFVNEKVEDIATEFNRYNRTKLVVEDPEIGCRRLGGRFSALDSYGFVVTLSRIVEMRIETTQTSSGAMIRLGRIPGAPTAQASPCGRVASHKEQ
jgi:transmembrane sensor